MPNCLWPDPPMRALAITVPMTVTTMPMMIWEVQFFMRAASACSAMSLLKPSYMSTAEIGRIAARRAPAPGGEPRRYCMAGTFDRSTFRKSAR